MKEELPVVTGFLVSYSQDVQEVSVPTFSDSDVPVTVQLHCCNSRYKNWEVHFFHLTHIMLWFA